MSIYNGWCTVEMVKGEFITLRVPIDVEVAPGKSVMLLYEEGVVSSNDFIMKKHAVILNEIGMLVAQIDKNESVGIKFKRALEQAAKDIGYMVQNVPSDVLGRAVELYEQEIEDNPVREIREKSRRK